VKTRTLPQLPPRSGAPALDFRRLSPEGLARVDALLRKERLTDDEEAELDELEAEARGIGGEPRNQFTRRPWSEAMRGRSVGGGAYNTADVGGDNFGGWAGWPE
jgi:hypothetical protein